MNKTLALLAATAAVAFTAPVFANEEKAAASTEVKAEATTDGAAVSTDAAATTDEGSMKKEADVHAETK